MNIGPLISVLLVLLSCRSTFGDTTDNEVDYCSLPSDLVKEIASYAPIVNNIINETIHGSFKGTTWQELATFVDKFGPRLAGSQVLEDAIDYMLNNSRIHNLENVHGEYAVVPHWVRYVSQLYPKKPAESKHKIISVTEVRNLPHYFNQEKKIWRCLD